MPARELLGAERKRFESRYQRYGFGDPSEDGGVDAPIGCVWYRLDGGIGEMLYIKHGLGRADWHLASTLPGGLQVVAGDSLKLRRELQLVKDAAAATVTPVGLPVPVLSGSIGNSDDQFGAWAQLTSGAVSGNIGGYQPVASTQVGRLFHWSGYGVWRIKTDVPSNLRWWIGLANANGIANRDTPGAGDHVAAFRWSSAAEPGSFFWRCVTHDGVVGPPTVTVTSKAITTGQRYKMVIVGEPDEIRFYIDDLENPVATHLTRLPTNATVLSHMTCVTTLSASAKSIFFSRNAFLFD